MKKDAANSDMLRGVVSTQRSGDFRMGKPNIGNAILSFGEYIANERETQRIETS